MQIFRYCNTYNGEMKLEVDGVFLFPKCEELIRFNNFPNANFPSDHLPLIVDFGYHPHI